MNIVTVDFGVGILNALKNDSIIKFHGEEGTQIIYMKKRRNNNG